MCAVSHVLCALLCFCLCDLRVCLFVGFCLCMIALRMCVRMCGVCMFPCFVSVQ